MICKSCGSFLSVTGEQAGSTAVCPNCRAALPVENTIVKCNCQNCKKLLQFEAWMEGESAVCPNCQQTMELKRPAVPAMAPPVLRFRTASAGSTPSAPPPKLTLPETSAMPVSVLAAESRVSPVCFSGTESAPDKEEVSEGTALAGKLTSAVKSGKNDETAPKVTLYGRYFKIAAVAAAAVSLLIVISIINSLVSPPSDSRIKKIVRYAADSRADKLKPEFEYIAPHHRDGVSKAVFAECFRTRNKEMLHVLLENRLADPALAFLDGKSLFDLAADKENRWLIDLFAGSKTDMDTRLSDGTTLLERAVKAGDSEFAGKLLSAGANADLRTVDGQPVVFSAVKNKEILQKFVEHGLDTNIRDRNLNTPLHAAVRQGQYDAAGYLIEKGADPAAANNMGDTALIIMARRKQMKHKFFDTLIRTKCGVNAENLNGDSALSLTIAAKSYDRIIPLLDAGLTRDSALIKNLPDELPVKKSILKHIEKLSERKKAEAEPAQKHNSPALFVKTFGTAEPVSVSLTYILLWLVWILSGFFSLNLLSRDDNPPLGGILNLLAFPAGPVIGIVCCAKFAGSRIFDFVRSQIDKKQAERLNKVRIFNAAGEDCSRTGSAESIALLNMCRNIFIKAVEMNCHSIIFNPSPNGYRITAQRNGKDAVLRNISLDMGKKTLVILKNLAGLEPYEEIAPQNGFFTVQNQSSRKRVIISTVGLGNNGERALLTVKDAEDNIDSWRQLPISGKNMRSIAELFKSQRGLLIITGAEKSACMRLTSLLLENCAFEIGSTVWVGDGSEPVGSPAVPRLKADPIAHITTGKLLAALPDCKVAGITAPAKDTDSMRYAVRTAGKKLVILVMECGNWVEAVNLLQRSGIPREELQAVLKLIITPRQLHLLCSCASPAVLPESMRADFAALDLPVDMLKKKNGCPECAQTGEERGLIIYDITEPSDSLLSSPKPDTWSVSRIAALVLASRGAVDINEAVKCFANFGGYENV